jgi:RimJ/RimL family protein N-acetyltransferase
MLYLKDSTFIGEIVAYEFTLDNSLTLGFRLFKQYQHLGYMQEALNEVVVYLFKKLHVNYISSKCYKDNLASKHLMEKIGYKLISNDDEFYYYQLHLIMANN